MHIELPFVNVLLLMTTSHGSLLLLRYMSCYTSLTWDKGANTKTGSVGALGINYKESIALVPRTGSLAATVSGIHLVTCAGTLQGNATTYELQKNG